MGSIFSRCFQRCTTELDRMDGVIDNKIDMEKLSVANYINSYNNHVGSNSMCDLKFKKNKCSRN